MDTRSSSIVATICLVVLLNQPTMLLPRAQAGEVEIPANVPAGSLIMRGPSADSPKAANTTSVTITEQQKNTPEFLFGLQVEQFIQTNGAAMVARYFDIDAFYRRVTATLPTTDAYKHQIETAGQSDIARRSLLKRVVTAIADKHTRFLGVRRFGNDYELLFRNADIKFTATYTAYVTERGTDGLVRMVDMHSFATGELMSRTTRRDALLTLVANGGLKGPLSTLDDAFVNNTKAWALFISRCEYGKFDLLKQAYDQLPQEIQNERPALCLYAATGLKSVKELMVPVERWHKCYPDDALPDLITFKFYVALCEGPRLVTSPAGTWNEIDSRWTSDDVDGAIAALQRANKWLADPILEIQMARLCGKDHPDKARSLLQLALNRFPLEPLAFENLLKLELTTTNFPGVAEALHLKEVALQTNMTAKVNSDSAYVAFRKSFPYKKWQHDFHGAQARELATKNSR